MSVRSVTQTLTELQSIHEELIHVSKQKTNIIKEGSVTKLQQLLRKERHYLKLLENAETKRQNEVEKWFLQQPSLLDKTITTMLPLITDEGDHENLEKMTIALTKSITRLKQQEQLNQELIEQSMQFVQISLDLMSPTIESLNYSNKQNQKQQRRSVFDSKA